MPGSFTTLLSGPVLPLPRPGRYGMGTVPRRGGLRTADAELRRLGGRRVTQRKEQGRRMQPAGSADGITMCCWQLGH